MQVYNKITKHKYNKQKKQDSKGNKYELGD